MAKKKKRKGGRRRKGRRKRGPSKKSAPLGASVGIGAPVLGSLISAYKQAGFSVDTLVLTGEKLTGYNANLGNFSVDRALPQWKVMAGGILVSASPRLPLIGMIARPVDRAIKRVSKGKVSL